MRQMSRVLVWQMSRIFARGSQNCHRRPSSRQTCVEEVQTWRSFPTQRKMMSSSSDDEESAGTEHAHLPLAQRRFDLRNNNKQSQHLGRRSTEENRCNIAYLVGYSKHALQPESCGRILHRHGILQRLCIPDFRVLHDLPRSVIFDKFFTSTRSDTETLPRTPIFHFLKSVDSVTGPCIMTRFFDLIVTHSQKCNEYARTCFLSVSRFVVPNFASERP